MSTRLTTTITALGRPAYLVKFRCADCGRLDAFEVPASELPALLATLYQDGLPPTCHTCHTCLLYEGERADGATAHNQRVLARLQSLR